MQSLRRGHHRHVVELGMPNLSYMNVRMGRSYIRIVWLCPEHVWMWGWADHTSEPCDYALNMYECEDGQIIHQNHVIMPWTCMNVRMGRSYIRTMWLCPEHVWMWGWADHTSESCDYAMNMYECEDGQIIHQNHVIMPWTCMNVRMGRSYIRIMWLCHEHVWMWGWADHTSESCDYAMNMHECEDGQIIHQNHVIMPWTCMNARMGRSYIRTMWLCHEHVWMSGWPDHTPEPCDYALNMYECEDGQIIHQNHVIMPWTCMNVRMGRSYTRTMWLCPEHAWMWGWADHTSEPCDYALNMHECEDGQIIHQNHVSVPWTCMNVRMGRSYTRTMWVCPEHVWMWGWADHTPEPCECALNMYECEDGQIIHQNHVIMPWTCMNVRMGRSYTRTMWVCPEHAWMWGWADHTSEPCECALNWPLELAWGLPRGQPS